MQMHGTGAAQKSICAPAMRYSVFGNKGKEEQAVKAAGARFADPVSVGADI
jgi:hypothetical protein